MTTHQKAISLKPLHTFQLPYSASEVITITEAGEVAELVGDYLVLGEGSNTIFTCDFSRPVLRIAINSINVEETDEGFHLSVGAGVNWHRLVRDTLEQNMPGLENLALIPGSVGAAPVQNIGAYGVEVGEFITSVTAWDREQREWREFSQQQCEFAYRDSVFKRHPKRFVITKVQFFLPKDWRPRLSYGALVDIDKHASAYDIMSAVIAIRNSKLPNPTEMPNAGSFFKNPEVTPTAFNAILQRHPDVAHYPLANGNIKLAAGWLIDKLGLKGFKYGGAAVHLKQALVLVNNGKAKGEDVVALARYIRQKVAEEFGVLLEAEVRLMDDNGLIEL
ncbi:UDP-N-acetylenolpyruvoylglucosamine reductase [Pseudidiomarina aquimaris]|uniref:UDP-N-acetylenolpyruvoylglucosamine reductase n=1 Tax=Pseudidiomarina aquimaris TaxID=641841 RepID=A0A432XIP5_9GAMM|nr:UDP-N-acetylmuramate dehydrogenase [Pseudidiomarina aquimaris]RUO48629.1 UDP-N-acetylenolpyruvoylglucosamine reductase [Pseudidiomarina aquimaris]